MQGLGILSPIRENLMEWKHGKSNGMRCKLLYVGLYRDYNPYLLLYYFGGGGVPGWLQAQLTVNPGF